MLTEQMISHMRVNRTTELPPEMFIELKINKAAAAKAAAKAAEAAAKAAAASRRAADDADFDDNVDNNGSSSSSDDDNEDNNATSVETAWKANKDSIGKVMEFVGFKLSTKFPQNICLMKNGSVVFCDSFIPASPADANQRPKIAGYQFNKVCDILF